MRKKINKIIGTLFSICFIAFAVLNENSQYIAISTSDKDMIVAMADHYNTNYKGQYYSYFWRILDDSSPWNTVLSETRYIFTPYGFVVPQTIHRFYW